MSLTDFKAKLNKSKINKYKINNNNKTNTKHEFNVKYERYQQRHTSNRVLEKILILSDIRTDKRASFVSPNNYTITN